MLNSHLIEYMGAIHRQQRSGLLTVIGPGFRLRICFEGGDPVALDLGADKELIIADELAVQHKIDAEGHRLLVEQYQAGAGTMAELARNANMANEDEVAAATRSTVESTLLRCFGTMHYEAAFDEQLNVDSFDFTTSAVRLRIATPQLLATVQPRVAEYERITAAVAPNAVFGLDENTNGNAQLTEVEKQIIDWIDGHRTVEEIAVGIRDSTINLSRVLLALVEKGVIRQIHLAVIQPAPPLPPPARRSSAEGSLRQLSPAAPPPSRIGLRVGVFVFLILLLVVVFGLSQGRQAEESRNQTLQALRNSVIQRSWNEAIQQADSAEKAAGNDVAAIEAAHRLSQFLKTEMQRERQEITELVDKGSVDQARDRLGRLPQDADTLALARHLKQAVDEANERAANLKDRIDRALQGGRISVALDELHGADPRDQAELGRIIDTWREEQITKAGRTSALFGERCLLLGQLAAAEPAAGQLPRIELIRAGVAAQRQHLTDLFADLGRKSEAGAWMEVAEAWSRERLGEQVHGSELAGDAERLRLGNDRIRGELTEVQTALQSLIRDGDDAQRMRAGAQQVVDILARRPQASNAVSLRALSRMLNEIAGTIREDAASDEVKALAAWLADHAAAPEEAAVVRTRIARLEEMERMANDTLERARAFARQDSWEQARRVLEDLCARGEWRKTRAHAAAVLELNAAKNLQSQRLAWRQDLDRALEKGASDQALAIARKMGLKYLPLRVESVPPGAEVLRDGQPLGVTPVTIDIPAADRTGLQLQLRRAGFVTQPVEVASAEAGWRIRRDLEREAAARVELNMTLTMRPVVAEGRLWTGNRQTLVALPLAAGGPLGRWSLDSGSADLAQPLYAQALITEGSAWLPTREGLALRVALDPSQGSARVPLVGRSDLALALHTSLFVVGRRFLLVAGHDGVLRAVDVGDPASTWSGPAGAPFATPPTRFGDDQVAILRRDGRLERYNPDDGTVIGSDELHAAVTGSWSDAAGLHAFAGGWVWHWDGRSLTREELPAQAVQGGAGVFIAGDGHVFLRGEGGWKDLGRVDGKPTAMPVAWAGHAVVPVGSRLTVLGPVPFVCRMAADILDPMVVDGQLVVPVANGVVLTYRP